MRVVITIMIPTMYQVVLIFSNLLRTCNKACHLLTLLALRASTHSSCNNPISIMMIQTLTEVPELSLELLLKTQLWNLKCWLIPSQKASVVKKLLPTSLRMTWTTTALSTLTQTLSKCNKEYWTRDPHGIWPLMSLSLPTITLLIRLSLFKTLSRIFSLLSQMIDHRVDQCWTTLISSLCNIEDCSRMMPEELVSL